METILVKYKGNGSSRYDEKEYLESAFRIRREKNVRGPLKIGENVTIKIKSRIWKAVVVNTNPDGPPKKKKAAEKQTAAEKQGAATLSNAVLASFPPAGEGEATTSSTTGARK